eukprot:4039087-Alexandrium_andersonii.AAC.1
MPVALLVHVGTRPFARPLRAAGAVPCLVQVPRGQHGTAQPRRGCLWGSGQAAGLGLRRTP